MAHECSHPSVSDAKKNAWVQRPHDPQMSTHGARAHGAWHQPASHRVMWTLPTLPPTKVLTTHGRWPMATPAGRPARWPPAAWPPGLLAAGRRPHGRPARWPPAARASPMGTRAGPAAKGHGSGGATNKIFYSPHCPHDPQIFKFIFYVYSTHTHGGCGCNPTRCLANNRQPPAVLARRVNV